MKIVRGDMLPRKERAYVLAFFARRSTRSHPPGEEHYPDRLAPTDGMWLIGTWFYVRDNGKVDRRYDRPARSEYPYPGLAA